MILTHILDYTVTAYQRAYANEFMHSFTHSGLATGACDLEQAQTIVQRLNQDSQRSMSCISFNEGMLSGSQLEGGACSAIAFRVAKQAFEVLARLRKESQLTAASRDKCFTIQLMRFIGELEAMATSHRSSDKGVQKEIRTEQLAFNTITVDREKVIGGNAVFAKIAALSFFYGLKVVESTPEIRVKGNEVLEKQLFEQLEKLEEGVYFLRIIQEKYNHKLEEKGHSVVYIKTGEGEYYFDPALGCYALFTTAVSVRLIYHALLSANARFGVDVLSFHRLEEGNSIISEQFFVEDPLLNGVIYSPCGLDEKFSLSILIFSHALGASIEVYKAIVEGLCREGFVVMCVNHPDTGEGIAHLEEAEIIKRGAQNGINIEKLVKLIKIGYFVKISASSPIGVIGHSLGGSASMEACRHTPHIQAAVNMDGRILDPEGIFQPVLQFVATKVKEERTAYHKALEGLMKTNAKVARLEVAERHGAFKDPSPALLKTVISQCALFFRENLVKGVEK